MAALRSLYRSSSSFGLSFYRSFVSSGILNDSLSKHQPSRSFCTLLRYSSSTTTSSTRLSSDSKRPFGLVIGSIRAYSQDVAPLPGIKDSEIKVVFKNFMAADWGDLSNALIRDVHEILLKDSEDKIGKEALKNVFCTADAAEAFMITLDAFRIAIDELVGSSGENMKPLPKDCSQALRAAYDRYCMYLKKEEVQTELGKRMIQLKMRCDGLDSE